jgi:hypothetical protein
MVSSDDPSGAGRIVGPRAAGVQHGMPDPAIRRLRRLSPAILRSHGRRTLAAPDAQPGSSAMPMGLRRDADAMRAPRLP